MYPMKRHEAWLCLRKSSILSFLLNSNHLPPHLKLPCPSSDKLCLKPWGGETDLRGYAPVSLQVNLAIKLISFPQSWCCNNWLFKLASGKRTPILWSNSLHLSQEGRGILLWVLHTNELTWQDKVTAVEPEWVSIWLPKHLSMHYFSQRF